MRYLEAVPAPSLTISVTLALAWRLASPLSLSDPSFPYSCTLQIEADIFEPQGISTLDAEASFITNDLLGSALTKSFSGKKVVEMPLRPVGGGGQAQEA